MNLHVDDRLISYMDGALPPAEYDAVASHLRACAACRDALSAQLAVQAAVGELPKELSPSRDLWAGIAARSGATSWRRWSLAAAAVIVVLLWWRATQTDTPSWDVARLGGAPLIDDKPLDGTGLLRPGQWIETDDDSRASLDVGAIGRVHMDPNTRLQLLSGDAEDHRLAMATGTIHARIWAPPRLFFVQTPSALAVDLGCEYTLEVDSLGSLLYVRSGYVEWRNDDGAAVVPAGSMCWTRPGLGPGTPFDALASETFREALFQYDFEGGPLGDVVDRAQRTEATSLWRLLYKVQASERERLYDRLVELVAPPEEVVREDVLRADLAAIKAWDDHLGLGLEAGWLLRIGQP